MAENGLTVYGSVPNATELISMMGSAIFKSGMLGCDNDSQGAVLAMTCFSKGSDPLSLAQRYNIIKGKLSMKADAMLAEFRSRGGRHKVVSRTAERAAIELTMDGHETLFEFRWDDARQEPFIYNGKEAENVRFIQADNQAELEKRLKPKYATARSRMQMLWARAVSDGVRTICPEVNLGTYTPEEIEDFDETPATSSAGAVNGEDKGRTAPPAASHADDSDDVEDAEYVVNTDDGKATGQQIARITESFKTLGMSPQVQLACAKKRGAESIATLTAEQADDLLQALDAKIKAKIESESDQSANAGESTSERIDAPVSQPKIEQITSLLRQLVQTEGNHDFSDRFKTKLAEKGLRLSMLSEPSADQVIRVLTSKNLDEFFKLDLKVAAKKD
jgi:hypothetical protein